MLEAVDAVGDGTCGHHHLTHQLTGGEFVRFTLVATAVAYVLWFIGIRRLPSVAPPLLGLPAPVTGAVMGLVLLGQSFTALQSIGFMLALTAIGYGAVAPVERNVSP